MDGELEVLSGAKRGSFGHDNCTCSGHCHSVNGKEVGKEMRSICTVMMGTMDDAGKVTVYTMWAQSWMFIQ